MSDHAGTGTPSGGNTHASGASASKDVFKDAIASAAQSAAKGAAAAQASSEPEKMVGGGPGDFIEIKAEALRATMAIKGTVAVGLAITRDDVAKKLQGMQIVNGVDWTAVDQVIASKQYDKPQVIALGSAARPGKDAFITEKIKIDPDVKPVVDKDGKADYRNVDNIHQVKKGDVLALKSPPIQGQEGKDIFGKILPAPPVKDVQFKPGANTEISSDGLQLLAVTGGYVYHQGGAISVGVTYVLKGDVDFKTGNLHYTGDIQVMGNVADGFTVESEGSIIVEGNVDAADVISHGSSVTIKSGIFGRNKGRIAAKTAVHVQSAQDAIIECETGLVDVGKGLRNCQVTAQTLKADKPGCSITGGTVKAYGEVSVAAVGAEGCGTLIRIVDKNAEAAKAKLKEIDKARADLLPKLEAVEKRLKGMKAMAEKFHAAMSERSKADLKGVLEQYAVLKKAEKDLDELKEKLQGIMLAAPRHIGKFVLTEKAVWGGHLEIYGHSRDLQEEDAKKEWVWAPDGLASRSIIPVAEKKDPATPGQEPAPPASP